MSSKYEHTLPMTPQSWTEQPMSEWHWDDIPPLSPFRIYNDSQLASYTTTTRVCCNQQALYIRYDCLDYDIWGTYTQRDEPIYDEEVVEIFIGHGEEDVIDYYEFQVSPDGVLFDATIHNPTSRRPNLKLNTAWNCEGIQWLAERNDADNHWMASLVIPWVAISPANQLPTVWRANFYRIERPRDAEPEYSCWSPTMIEPPDFHQPAYFGTLRLPSFT